MADRTKKRPYEKPQLIQRRFQLGVYGSYGGSDDLHRNTPVGPSRYVDPLIDLDRQG